MKSWIFLFVCLYSITVLSQAVDSLDIFTIHVAIEGHFAGYDPDYNVEVIQEGIGILKLHTSEDHVTLNLDRRKAHLVKVNHISSVPEQAYFPALKYASGEEIQVELKLTNIVCRLQYLEDFPVMYYGQNETKLRSDQMYKLSVVDSIFIWERKLQVELVASKNEYETQQVRLDRKRELKRLLVEMGISGDRIAIGDEDKGRNYINHDGLEEITKPYAADRRVEISIVGFNDGDDTR